MNVLFRRLKKTDDAALQLQAKYLQLFADADVARDLALQALALRETAEPPLLLEHQIAPMSDAHRQRLQQVKHQHLAVFHRSHPLLPGETLEHESCAFLAEDWDDHPKGTAVVVRDTSVCREIHLFPYIRFEHPEVRFVEPEPRTVQPPPRLLMLMAATPASDTFIDMASQLGTGLLKSALGMAAGKLFETLFPPGPPAWVEQLYTEVRRIVHDEIEQARIGEMTARLGEAAQHVADYGAFRARKRPLRDCVEHLNEAYKILVHAKTQLEQIGVAGIYIYCVAVGQMLLVMQELACNDADAIDRPLDSPWADLIRNKVAPGAVAHAQKMYTSIVDTRMAKITPITGKIMFKGHWWVYFKDTETGAEFEGRYGGHCYQDEYKERHADLARQREPYVKQVRDALITRLAGVKLSTQAWTDLSAQPLGKLDVVAPQTPA